MGKEASISGSHYKPQSLYFTEEEIWHISDQNLVQLPVLPNWVRVSNSFTFLIYLSWSKIIQLVPDQILRDSQNTIVQSIKRYSNGISPILSFLLYQKREDMIVTGERKI